MDAPLPQDAPLFHGWEVDISVPGYRITGYLGRGAFGTVNKAIQQSTDRPVAIKMISVQDVREYQRQDKVDMEISIMRSLVSPHIIQLYEVVHTSSHICLVMEYASNGDFLEYINAKLNLDENEARPFFLQLIAGVEYCHQNNVVHRDLKLENLLLDDRLNLKITDFNLSTIMNGDNLLEGFVGSLHYSAPEVISENPYRGPPVDVWSCGVILYAMLCGFCPFQGQEDTVPLVLWKIERGIYEPIRYVSSDAKDLIGRMLTVDPIQRITIPEIRQHPWFQA